MFQGSVQITDYIFENSQFINRQRKADERISGFYNKNKGCRVQLQNTSKWFGHADFSVEWNPCAETMEQDTAVQSHFYGMLLLSLTQIQFLE